MKDATPHTEGIILAAGLSTRAGQYKMALRLGDKTLIEHSITGMAPVVERIFVVGGYRIEVLRQILAGYSQVEVVHNTAFRDGMFSSVRAGLQRVRAERAFLLPGDYPLVSTETYLRLLAEPGDVVIPTCGGRKGHPVLLSAHAIAEILRQPGTSTLRDCIRQIGAVTVDVQDEGILLDVDFPDDFEAVKRVYEDEH